MLGLSVPALRAKLSEHNGYVPLAYQVTGTVEQKIAGLDLPYLTFAPDLARTDPDGDLFSPVLGIVGFSGQGLSGLEYLENSLLAGSAGSEVVPTGPNGEGLPGSPTDVVAARQGTSLVLSLDEPLQFEVTKDLSQQITATHATGGVAIVEDRRTGGILAMVDLVVGPHGEVVPSDQNLAVTSVYQPGSVMKLVTISGALQSGLITPSSVFTVPYQISLGGWPFSDADYHPTEQLTRHTDPRPVLEHRHDRDRASAWPGSPFVLPARPRLWPADGPRVAGRDRWSRPEPERPGHVVALLDGNGPHRYRRGGHAASDPGRVQHGRERR